MCPQVFIADELFTIIYNLQIVQFTIIYNLQNYLQLLRHGSNLSVHQQMTNKEDVVYIYYLYIYIYTHTHTHNGILLSHKKNEIFPLC